MFLCLIDGPVTDRLLKRQLLSLLSPMQPKLGVFLFLHAIIRQLLCASGNDNGDGSDLQPTQTFGGGSASPWEIQDSAHVPSYRHLSWQSAPDRDLESPPETAPSASPPSKAFKPGRHSLTLKTAVGFLGLALLVALALGHRARQAMASDLEDIWLERGAYRREVGGPYIEMLQRQRLQQETLSVRVRELLRTEKEAEELAALVTSKEAQRSFNRLRLHIRAAERQAQRLEEAVKDERDIRDLIAPLSRQLDYANAETGVLFELAQRFVAETAQEAASFVHDTKELAKEIACLASQSTSAIPNADVLRAHSKTAKRLAAEAAEAFDSIQLAPPARTGKQSHTSSPLSLRPSVATAKKAAQVRRRLQETAAEAKGWARDEEEAAGILARNALADICLQSLYLLKQKEQFEFNMTAAETLDRHSPQTQRYWSLIEHIDKSIEEVHTEYRGLASLPTARDMIQAANRAGDLLQKAETALIEASSIAGSLIGFEAANKPLRDPPSLSGRPLDPLGEDSETQKRLLSIAALAADIAGFTDLGFVWGRPFKAAKMYEPFGIPEILPEAALKPKWYKAVVAVTRGAAIAKTLMDGVKAHENDIRGVSAKTDALLEHSSSVVAHSQRAAKWAIEAKVWSRLEKDIIAAVSDYHAAVAAPDAFDEGFMKPQTFSNRISDIYQQTDMKAAAHLLNELKQEMWGYRQQGHIKSFDSEFGLPESAPPPQQQPAVALAKDALVKQAEVADKLVTQRVSKLAKLAQETSGWFDVTGIVEARDAAATALAAKVAVQSKLTKFRSACDSLKDAKTETQVKAAGWQLLKAKDEVLDLLFPAHSAAQKAALAIHQKGFFPAIAKIGDSSPPGSTETPPSYAVQLQDAFQLASKANDLHQNLVERLSLMLDKNSFYDSKAATRLREERATTKSFVQRVSDLAQQAAKGTQPGKLLLAEASHCVYQVWMAYFNIEALLTDRENNLNMNKILSSLAVSSTPATAVDEPAGGREQP